MGGKSWVPRGTRAILPVWTLPPGPSYCWGQMTGSRTRGSAPPCPVHLQGRHFAGRQVPSVQCSQEIHLQVCKFRDAYMGQDAFNSF